MYQCSTGIYGQLALVQKNRSAKVTKKIVIVPLCPKIRHSDTKKTYSTSLFFFENITNGCFRHRHCRRPCPPPAQYDASNPLIASSATWCALGSIQFGRGGRFVKFSNPSRNKAKSPPTPTHNNPKVICSRPYPSPACSRASNPLSTSSATW